MFWTGDRIHGLASVWEQERLLYQALAGVVHSAAVLLLQLLQSIVYLRVVVLGKDRGGVDVECRVCLLNKHLPGIDVMVDRRRRQGLGQ